MNNIIKCNVLSCQHNINKFCSLNEVNISCTCDENKCIHCKETICKSFQTK